MKLRSSPNTSGSTLLLALWALLLLSAVVFAWVQLVDKGIDRLREANRGMEARALAHSGMAVALHPGITSNSPHLHNNFGRGGTFNVTMKGEGARININYLLAGAEPNRMLFLKNYLAKRGLNIQECEVFVDCLLDWTSPPSNTRRRNTPPEGPDYQPPHRPLQSLDEIPQIKGCAPLVSTGGWRDELTLLSSGPLDLDSVSAEILGFVPGISEQRAQQFVKTRTERERQDVNKDGHAFKSLDEAISFLGLSKDQFLKLSGLLGFRDPVVRIQSVGESGKVIRQVEAIVRKVPEANSQILLWTEK